MILSLINLPLQILQYESNCLILRKFIHFINTLNKMNLQNPNQDISSSLQSTVNQIKKQQKKLHLQSLIGAFSDPSIKNLQSHNKNKLERELLQIATNFYSLMDKFQIMKSFCIDYKTTLQTYKKQENQIEKINKNQFLSKNNDLNQFKKTEKMINQNANNKISSFLQQNKGVNQNNLTLSNSQFPNNQLTNQIQQQVNPKPLIVLPAKRFQTSKRQVQQAINKLKVMVVKVNTKQSSAFEHVYSTYISRLKYTLTNSNLQQKRFQMSKIKKILNYLPKKYLTLKLESSNIYPFHQTRYPNMIGFQYKESPLLFINFYCQQLLFVNLSPIRLKQNIAELLYCPVTLVKSKSQQSLQVSGWYMQQLISIDPVWRDTLLVIKVYNIKTSLHHPVYYSHIYLKKFELSSQLKSYLDSNHHSFNFMQHKYSNQQKFLSDLVEIKTYLYQVLIFNHLQHLLGKVSTKRDMIANKVEIMIEGGFKVQFQLITDMQVRNRFFNLIGGTRSNGRSINANNKQSRNISDDFSKLNLEKDSSSALPQPVYKAQLILDLLLFYKRKNLFCHKRTQLTQDLQVLFKTTLFKTITEDIEYRTINPAYVGSLGMYFYDKRSVRKHSVNNFLQKFNEGD